MVESDHFLFTDNSTGHKIGDDVILLKIILGNIKPSIVIDLQDFEEKLASAIPKKTKKTYFPARGRWRRYTIRSGA